MSATVLSRSADGSSALSASGAKQTLRLNSTLTSIETFVSRFARSMQTTRTRSDSKQFVFSNIQLKIAVIKAETPRL